MSPVRPGPRAASLRPLRAAVLLLAALLWTLPVHAQDDPLVIHFLDVGQGDAVLVEEPEGGTVLYDGGPSRDTALHHLEALGVDDVDLVVASHPHLDHVGGLPAVLETYTPQFVIDNGLTHTTRAYERYLEAVDRAGSQLLEPELRTITVGEMDLRVLPPPNRPDWGLNDNSVGLVVGFGEFRATLGGDAEQRQWRWWLNEGVVPEGPVQVHKASHHCSRNGDTRSGIERLRPQVVVIGVGADNRFGHPHPEALALHGAVDAEVYRTDQHGTVRVVAHENGGFEVETERDVPHAASEPNRDLAVDPHKLMSTPETCRPYGPIDDGVVSNPSILIWRLKSSVNRSGFRHERKRTLEL